LEKKWNKAGGEKIATLIPLKCVRDFKPKNVCKYLRKKYSPENR